ncbi:hypothetical protein [Chromatium okenii]|uniref:hypothetical protein n=1 Tax=Chromatium okenii TaxID=61644 RepID=UPI0019085929|nr:hypothetical protein [Chromatium okenii]
MIELTATPVAGNNVLYSVSAQELKAEQMIKLPIVLLEHPDGWQACLSDAVLNRNQLELTAQKETDHIRPILLVQAASKGGEATVDVVRQYLIEHEQIPEQHIAIATGTQKELDGINLFERSCQIRVVITIEALKEGWDCSFAYVLASLQNIKSAKDIEQLLGRVLRMPYAKMREQAALNCAYAHVIAESFASAAATLTDRLVQNMGFERLELAAVLIPQTVSPLTGGANNAVTIPAYSIEVPQLPDTRHWPASIKAAIDIRPTTQGATLLISSALDAGTLAQVESLISAAQPAKARAAIQEQFAAHRALQQALRAPAHLGIQFAPVPHLCLRLDDHLEVVEPETLAAVGQWNLLDHPVQLAGFAPTESVNTFEIDLNEQQVNYRYLDGLALQLNEAPSQVTEDGLLRELDRHLRRPSLSQLHLQRYLIKLIAHLIHDRGFTLTALVRWRVQLVRAINKEIERLQHLAMQKGFQQHLPKMVPPSFQELAQYSFQFDPGKYPARNCYQGRYQFSKHFYPTIHDLRETTASGLISEEFRCAQMIDMQAKVKHWVRNIERQAQCSFWLPTASDRFYPDFVAELNDGRVFTVEYKGEFYKSNDDSREKKQVGQQWETSSNGRCLFLFAVSEDEAGRSIGQQIKEKLV